MIKPDLLLVLGDQLSADRGVLKDARPGVDVVVMAEVKEEARYVRHNRHKIALIFAAMRHFRQQLRERGLEVIYFDYQAGVESLEQAVELALERSGAGRVRCCEPGEYRVLAAMRTWGQCLSVPVEVVEDDRFLASHQDFENWAEGKKQLRMEFFYRQMRKRYGILIDEAGAPEGGKWNYDADNRAGWRGKSAIPERPTVVIDKITREVIELVEREFPDHPGDLSRFYLAVTAEDAQRALNWFIEHCLPTFGRYQDAMAEESPWLFHSLVSMYLNAGLLDPLEVCQQVEGAWREGQCELSAAEGFIRQVLGWREYVRGIYWLKMPEYAERNGLQATRPLPDFFWTASTDLRCLQQALTQTLDLGYAHHIQRLMVIGNFALLAGLDIKSVCDWYLAVYVDAYEWVELPNTLGMALHADNGLMASKPYAASGKYIQRQGNHCKQCRYKPTLVTGPDACPFNSMYWHFIDRNLETLRGNARMGLTVRNWDRKEGTEQQAIVAWADSYIEKSMPAARSD
ncbi:MAG: deoxyribodipyrimidine photolyase-related protein [Halieaceae bacterium]|jgi:deoxyribodipyrimidine photolyase-related protein